MKHIKLFENFLIEGTGLITGKYNIDDVIKAIDKAIELSKKYFLGEVLLNTTIFYIKTDKGLPSRSASSMDKPSYIAMTLSKDNSYQGYYSPDGYFRINIDFYIKSSFIEKQILISHEFTHALDRGARYYTDEEKMNKYREKITGFKDEKSLLKWVDDEFNKTGKMPKSYGKYYLKQTAEIEAWIGQIAYVLNDLLLKNPEKIETVKDLYRKGDIDISKAFPELESEWYKSVIRYCKRWKVYKEKFIKRIYSVLDTQEKGQKLNIVFGRDTNAERERNPTELVNNIIYRLKSTLILSPREKKRFVIPEELEKNINSFYNAISNYILGTSFDDTYYEYPKDQIENTREIIKKIGYTGLIL